MQKPRFAVGDVVFRGDTSGVVFKIIETHDSDGGYGVKYYIGHCTWPEGGLQSLDEYRAAKCAAYSVRWDCKDLALGTPVLVHTGPDETKKTIGVVVRVDDRPNRPIAVHYPGWSGAVRLGPAGVTPISELAEIPAGTKWVDSQLDECELLPHKNRSGTPHVVISKAGNSWVVDSLSDDALRNDIIQGARALYARWEGQ